jgi:alpha-galactosidase
MTDHPLTSPLGDDVLHLRRGGTSVVVDLTPEAGPAMIHWGEALSSEASTLRALAIAARPQRPTGGLDRPSLPALVPTAAGGWAGTPGWAGHRAGRSFSTLFTLESVDVGARGDEARLLMTDREAMLSAELQLRVDEAGLLWQCLAVRNTGDDAYTVNSAQLSFEVPSDAREILDTAGRWSRERAPQRLPFAIGSHVRESRRGRPGSDATLLLAAGRPGFGFEAGRVHAVHLAWSGNYRLAAERGVEGSAVLTAGELIEAGEVILLSGAEYRTPWAVGSWGDGLSELSHRFHRTIREQPHRAARPRPITFNTWEAVQFDHDTDRLLTLVDLAAEVGMERFVLDDGWFLGRRHDRVGVGDWDVDPEVWPQGLHPLVDRIVAAGMEFGLWIEPEMVSSDSELARRHPDWMLRARRELPPTVRGQQVLDLTHPSAYQHVVDHIDRLLDEYPIASLKWDHNRDLLDAGDGPGGRARSHAQTEALYRMLDEVRRKHPGLEIESSASGGARIDLGILSRVDRVWTSDSLDPLERLPIQRYTGLVVAPEMLGAHVTVDPTSRGPAAVALSAMVAMLGHFGIECDLANLTSAELETLRTWIGIAKQLRDLVRNGVRVDVDDVDPGLDVRGVVAADRGRAVFTIVQVQSGPSAPPGRVRLPGLDPDLTYRLRTLGGTPLDGLGRTPLEWADQPLALTGRELEAVGIRPPILRPRSGLAIELVAESADRGPAPR